MTVAASPKNDRPIQKSSFDRIGLLITLLTILVAIFWAFPIYWALVTSFKPEQDVVQPGVEFWPKNFTFDAYSFVVLNTKLAIWYLNSLFTSTVITVLVLIMSASTGYAISQIQFPGRNLLWWMILASFMVPIPALIINHFVLMNQLHLINTSTAIILPQLVAPVTVIIYKQFFDSVPKDFRDAAIIDGATELQLLYRLYLPMNWGITTALAIITFIGALNQFLWPFLVSTSEATMTVTVGITQVRDAFGVRFARELATAILAALPVAALYLIFQRRVTQAIMLTAGIKG